MVPVYYQVADLIPHPMALVLAGLGLVPDNIAWMAFSTYFLVTDPASMALSSMAPT